MSPKEILAKGVLLLEPVLTTHNFSFVLREEGASSGGAFAAGEFVRGDRRLEPHFRHSLGLVTYHVGAAHVSHVGYMEELGVREQAAYPGFSSDPFDGFRHLADDIDRFASDFVAGNGSMVMRAAAREQAQEGSKNRTLMATYVGDARTRAEAKRQFEARDWNSVVSLLESLQYPDQMNVADHRRLEIARRRASARSVPPPEEAS
jgi:hypothetical protein